MKKTCSDLVIYYDVIAGTKRYYISEKGTGKKLTGYYMTVKEAERALKNLTQNIGL